MYPKQTNIMGNIQIHSRQAVCEQKWCFLGGDENSCCNHTINLTAFFIQIVSNFCCSWCENPLKGWWMCLCLPWVRECRGRVWLGWMDRSPCLCRLRRCCCWSCWTWSKLLMERHCCTDTCWGRRREDERSTYHPHTHKQLWQHVHKHAYSLRADKHTQNTHARTHTRATHTHTHTRVHTHTTQRGADRYIPTFLSPLNNEESGRLMTNNEMLLIIPNKSHRILIMAIHNSTNNLWLKGAPYIQQRVSAEPGEPTDCLLG